MKSTPSSPKTIDDYIAQFPGDIQVLLTRLRLTIKAAAPAAEEKISYRMPTFALYGNLVHFAAWRSHIGFYPGASGIAAFEQEFKDYKIARGSVQLPYSRPIPYGLIEKIVIFRVAENLSKTKSKRKS